MKLGLYLRNMGPQSTKSTLVSCARSAEDAGIDDLWVADHIAIPPDDAEGSQGRYLDPLATLAFLAGVTRRIALGTGVLVLPYRPPLATAKWVATIQELSEGRLLLGVGVGWMKPEFQAVGADIRNRGRDSDRALDFLNRCFASDEVEENGQRFLFRPRPERPPIFVGGAAPHALHRTVRFGDGWMPMGLAPDALAPLVEELRQRAQEAGKASPGVVAMTALPIDDPPHASAILQDYARAGATRIVHACRYADAEEFARTADSLAQLREGV